jgi:hypothetical protein
MRNTWNIFSENLGTVRITITADTDARGITITDSTDWHSYDQIELVASLLAQANAWLLENGGTV